MNRERLLAAFDGMTQDEEQKARMKKRILAEMDRRGAGGRADGRPKRTAALAASAAGLLLAVVFIARLLGQAESAYAISVRAGEDGAVFRLADGEGRREGAVTSVRYVDPRPMLEFYIEGDDIASIRIAAKNEYVYAVDWTKTQHEKYRNPEYYQRFDGETRTSEADFDLLYDKELTMTFDRDFRDYGEIWYRWVAWDMYRWAAEDNFSRFYGYGQEPIAADIGNLTEQEKAELAAGEGSAVGHMNLTDYPDQLKEDIITITITDRLGRVTTKSIHVRVDNNRIGQTVVTARLMDG